MVTVHGADVEVLSLPADAAEMAAVAILGRYSARTLEAYRQDLRGFFTWMTSHGVAVLDAARAHIELYRASMEARELAAVTIDRRLSTVCGFYRFAHIDGRIPVNPATYVRRPEVPETIGHGMDRGELGVFLFAAERFDPMHAALAVLLGLNGLRVSEACGANLEDLGGAARASHPGHRRQRQQASAHLVGAPNGAHHRPGGRGPLRGSDPGASRRPPSRSTHGPPMGPRDRSAGRDRGRSSAHASARVHHGRPRLRRPAARCAAGCASPRPPHHHRL